MFFKTLRRHGLTPDMDVLDVGCGQGRMARPLVEFLGAGTYSGFDIVKSGIDWCKTHYLDVPNFKFDHVPVYNKRYNKSGVVKASEFTFPYKDNQFDMVFLTSVFTHMFAKDVENYLLEIARILRPGGKCLITWFLLNEQSRAAREPFYNFAYDFDNVSKTTTPKSPEAAMAFDEEFVRGLYEKTGLVMQDIELGSWANPNSEFQLQDMIIAKK
ncbi:MAG: class I SAM-dependent methyltransferase [Hellea sp.]|nr:class I SAM-dependent methyltransferase [Hellea sp.]